MTLYYPAASYPASVTCGTPAYTCQGACSSSALGGIKSVKGEFPYLVQIYSGGRFLCGGTIVSNKFILTSATCIEPSSPPSVAALRVRAGDFKLNTASDGLNYVERNVTTIYRSPEFVPQRKNPAVHDIALLKLTEPLAFTDFIRPICLDDPGQRVDNGFTEGMFAGYGKLSYNNRPTTDDQYKVNVRIGTPQECQNAYSAQGVQLMDSQICAGTNTVPSVDPCVGDNGGPLIVKTGPNSYKQVGVASFGLACSGPPAVFTRVSSYRAWIQQVMQL
jgi:secreted trypsin-like serine protease